MRFLEQKQMIVDGCAKRPVGCSEWDFLQVRGLMVSFDYTGSTETGKSCRYSSVECLMAGAVVPKFLRLMSKFPVAFSHLIGFLNCPF